MHTVFALLCSVVIKLTDFPISIRLTSLALWQSNDCPSASKATLMNMDKYFMWIHYERLHNHNKAKHNKTVCIFLGIYCSCYVTWKLWCLKSPAIWLINIINKKRQMSEFSKGYPPLNSRFTWGRDLERVSMSWRHHAFSIMYTSDCHHS